MPVSRPDTQVHPHELQDGSMGLRCRSCRCELPLSMFTRSSRAKCGYDTTCRECQKWRMKRHHYGVTREQYQSMLESQGGVCATCGHPPSKTNCRHGHLVVDHCHKTTKVRQLLCSDCNTLLGMAKDSVGLLEAAAKYLLRHQTEAGRALRKARSEMQLALALQ